MPRRRLLSCVCRAKNKISKIEINRDKEFHFTILSYHSVALSLIIVQNSTTYTATVSVLYRIHVVAHTTQWNSDSIQVLQI